jgi:hypothetical protein
MEVQTSTFVLPQTPLSQEKVLSLYHLQEEFLFLITKNSLNWNKYRTMFKLHHQQPKQKVNYASGMICIIYFKMKQTWGITVWIS